MDSSEQLDSQPPEINVVVNILRQLPNDSMERKRLEDETEAWRTFDALSGGLLIRHIKQTERLKELKLQSDVLQAVINQQNIMIQQKAILIQQREIELQQNEMLAQQSKIETWQYDRLIKELQKRLTEEQTG